MAENLIRQESLNENIVFVEAISRQESLNENIVFVEAISRQESLNEAGISFRLVNIDYELQKV